MDKQEYRIQELREGASRYRPPVCWHGSGVRGYSKSACYNIFFFNLVPLTELPGPVLFENVAPEMRSLRLNCHLDFSGPGCS